MGNKQNIRAGAESTNIQGEDVSVNQYVGMSYSDVKEVAMDIFKANFYELGKDAAEIARGRAEELTNQYLMKLKESSSDPINNTNDPDVQHAIFTAQKAHARLGNQQVADLLVDILVDRTKTQEDPFVKLVLNEALEVIPKLTLKQIDILSLIFIMKHVAYENLMKIEEFYYFFNSISSNIPRTNTSMDEIFYHHLEYAGCTSISVMSLQFEDVIITRYPERFTEGRDRVLGVLQEINIGFLEMSKDWNDTKLCNSSLTSVGLAIALSNIKRKFGFNWDLSVWVKE